METLSTVANVGGVVGLADVALKLAATLIDLIRRASSASRTIAELYSRTQSLASVLVEVHIWAEEYRQSPFVGQDGQRVSINLEEALRKCKEQLANLAGTLESRRMSKGGLFGQWKANVGFALSEAQAHHATQMVVHHHNTLKMLLQVRENRDLIVLRKEIGYLRLTVHDTESRIMASTNALNHRVSRHLALPASSSTATLRSPSSRANESPSSGSTCAQRVPSSTSPVLLVHGEGVSIRSDFEMSTFKRNFQDWSIAQPQPVTTTAYALAAVGTQVSRAKSDSTTTLLTRFPLSVTTHLLMMLAKPLVSRIIAIAKREFPRSDGCTEIPGDATTHACASCVGSNALWIISSVQHLLGHAHMASAASITSELIPMWVGPDISELEVPSVLAATHASNQEALEDIDHQSTEKTTLGTLLLRWRISKRESRYEENIVSFAFASDKPLDAVVSGLFGAFAKVRSYEPCRLYTQPSWKYFEERLHMHNLDFWKRATLQIISMERIKRDHLVQSIERNSNLRLSSVRHPGGTVTWLGSTISSQVALLDLGILFDK